MFNYVLLFLCLLTIVMVVAPIFYYIWVISRLLVALFRKQPENAFPFDWRTLCCWIMVEACGEMLMYTLTPYLPHT